MITIRGPDPASSQGAICRLRKKALSCIVFFAGRDGGARTHTTLRSPDFKSDSLCPGPSYHIPECSLGKPKI